MNRLDGHRRKRAARHAALRARPRAAGERGRRRSAFGVHRSVARGRLERLAAAGLLEPAFERRTGRQGPGAGRPAKVYAVAPELAPLEFPDRHSEELVSLLACRPSGRRAGRDARSGRRALRRAARRGTPPSTRRTTSLLRSTPSAAASAGSATTRPSSSRNAEGGTLATPTCPLRPLTVVADPVDLRTRPRDVAWPRRRRAPRSRARRRRVQRPRLPRRTRLLHA